MNQIKLGIAMALALAATTPAGAETVPPLPAMPLFQNWVTARMRLTIVAGRIVHSAGWQFGTGTLSNGSRAGLREQMTFRGNGTTGVMTYEYTSPREEIAVTIDSEGSFRYHRQGKGDHNVVSVRFSQLPGEPFTLAIGPESRQDVYRGTTLWHLLLTEPERCGQHLTPLLQVVRPQGNLARTAESIEKELLRGAAAGKRSDRQQWAALVVQLGDDQFTKREAADRQLRAAGTSALGYLQQLDLTRFDAEQQFRIRRIVKTLTRQRIEDTPEHVASWLAEDPMIWLALLGRPDAATRRVAAQQLATLLGETIPVDPAADPATQKSQRELLRARIEKPPPSPPKPATS